MPHLSARIHFSQINLLSVLSYYQHHHGLYYWYCSLDLYDGANGPILVSWALRKYQALYEDLCYWYCSLDMNDGANAVV